MNIYELGNSLAHIADFLAGMAVGSEVIVEPSGETCIHIGNVVSRIMAQEFDAWAWERLDGIPVCRALRRSKMSIEFFGIAVVLGEQTLSPFLLRICLLEVAVPKLRYVSARLGEDGVGRLGKPGPAANSGASARYINRIMESIGGINWKFRVDFPKEANRPR